MRLALCSLLVLALQQKPAWDDVLAAGRKNLERLQTLKGMLPRADFDPAARAEALGGDVDRALDFVRTSIAHEAYRGVMKGARGALISRRANAADRALLLAALLPGKDAKLVKGALPEEKQPAPALPAWAAPDRNVEPIAAKFGADPAKLKQKAEAAAVRAQEFRAALKTRTDRDRTLLALALDTADVHPPRALPPGDETWWVRIGDRDLLKPEGAEERAVIDPAQLPPEDVHRLAVRMFIRRGDEEVPVLDVGFRAADLYGKTLRLANVASDNPGRLTKVRGPKFKEYLDAMAATTQFIPLLEGGGERPITGHPFDLSGNRMTVKNGVVEKVQQVSGLFDTLPGGEPGKKQELDGCRIETELLAPGDAPRVARRTLWDRKGGKPGRQRVFDLLQSREILVLPGELSAEAALDAALEVDLASREAMLKQLVKPERVVKEVPPRVNARLYQFALLRAAALRELGPLSAPRPTLVSFVARVLDGRGPAVRAGFDVLSNPLAGPDAKSWKDSAVFAAGVLDTALEHEILKTRKSAHANASVALEKASKLAVEKGEGVLRVRSGASWYEVDSRTGTALGYMDEGGGQDMAEYAMLLIEKVKEIREWQSHAELLEAALDCAMQAIDSADAERAFATCIVGVGIGEAFGWAAGGIIGGAADAIGGPAAALGGMAFEDWMTGAFGDAVDAATGGR
jgi:hypothetical protein